MGLCIQQVPRMFCYRRCAKLGSILAVQTLQADVWIACSNRAILPDQAHLSTVGHGQLEKLSLGHNTGCPAAECSQCGCRLYVIHRCKHLKQLDFKKVKQKEREAAAAKYASGEAVADGTAATFEPDEELQQAEASRQQVGLALQQQTCWHGGLNKQSNPNRQRQAI